MGIRVLATCDRCKTEASIRGVAAPAQTHYRVILSVQTAPVMSRDGVLEYGMRDGTNRTYLLCVECQEFVDRAIAEAFAPPQKPYGPEDAAKDYQPVGGKLGTEIRNHSLAECALPERHWTSGCFVLRSATKRPIECPHCKGNHHSHECRTARS